MLNWIVELAESLIFRRDYFPVKNRFVLKSRLFLLWEILRDRCSFHQSRYTIYGFINTVTDERAILPVIRRIAARQDCRAMGVRAHLVSIKAIDPAIQAELIANGCSVDRHLPSILKLCVRSKTKLGLFCLDQRHFYQHHGVGVDVVETVRKFGVKTASIQHGGTRQDAVQGLASSVSDVILVWGERIYRELQTQYQVAPERLRIVGNHLHDRIPKIDPEHVRAQIQQLAPSFKTQDKKQGKKVVLLATCLHSEYVNRDNEQEAYREYIQHLYASLDFSQVCLIVKMHPADSVAPNLYAQYLPEAVKESGQVLILDPSQTQLDIYSLLLVCDLLVTRASTVAEEALMLGKSVVAFDLDQAGPSSAYLHLKEYGQFRIVYQDPAIALRETVSSALETPVDLAQDVTADMTYRLDGRSCDRAVDALLNLLKTDDDRNSLLSPISSRPTEIASELCQ